MSAPHKRHYFLRDTFQSRFIMVSLAHYLIITLTFIGALFLPLVIQLDNLSLSLAEKGEVANQFISLHERMWLPLLAILVLLTLHSVFFSHRIAGPLYRFRNVFKAVGEGNLSLSVKIRDGDYLHKEAEVLSTMILSLAARMRGIEAQYDEVHRVVAELNRAVEGGSMHDVDQTRKRLEEELERLKASLGQFRTTAEQTEVKAVSEVARC